MATTVPSCSLCANLIDGRCHGLPPRVGNLAGSAVWPRIPHPESTVCRAFTTNPIGSPEPPPSWPPWPPWPDWPPLPPCDSPGRSERLLAVLVALLGLAVLLAIGLLALALPG